MVIKLFAKDRLIPSTRKHVENEVKIHSLMNHPSVLPMLLAFEDCNKLYLALQYASGGTLRTLMRCGMSEKSVRDIIVAPLLNALAFMDDRGIVHRDIKPENVLMHEGKALLADFGLSLLLSPLPPSDHNRDTSSSDCTAVLGNLYCSGASEALCSTAGGTPMYTAPEVLLAVFKNQKPADVISPKNDVWALGMMALEALAGSHPFAPHHRSQVGGGCAGGGDGLLYQIAYHTTIQLPHGISSQAADFLLKALQRDPSHRPSASELAKHPWLASSSTNSPQDEAKPFTSSRAISLPPAFNIEVECWEY
eukprot:gene23525-9047_t